MSKNFIYKITMIPTKHTLMYVIGNDLKEFHNLTSRTEVTFADHGGWFIPENTFGPHIILLEKFNEGLLIHENSHVVDYIFKDIGSDSGEFRAYWNQYLFSVIKDEYKKWKKDNKK